MSHHYMDVNVSSSEIAKNMDQSPEFAFNVLSELAYLQNGRFDELAEQLFKYIFEEEDEDILLMFNAIVKQFEHLREDFDETV